MNYASLDISLAAVIPAILLAVFVFLKDKTEKEPLPLLLLLFGLGAVAFFPAHYAENALISLFDTAFADFFEFTTEGGMTVLSEAAYYCHRALCYFVGVGLVEESIKWILLFLITRKSVHFNYLFDGIVYAVFLSMGFSAVENVWYAWLNGWDTLLLRSLSSVPGHLFFGIMMGCFYSIWHTRYAAKCEERRFAGAGLLTVKKPFSSGGWLAAAFIVPILLHGGYCFVGYFSSSSITLGFYLVTTILYLLCFYFINRMSDADVATNRSVVALLKKKYPDYETAAEVQANEGVSGNE
ncbi:MAG: PrsW family intramembrane metalloprotease [Ruminococcaceae bacterium]|nr:PrsW family intramembrane metalloprotease [Oscillospiraceae bacterium]